MLNRLFIMLIVLSMTLTGCMQNVDENANEQFYETQKYEWQGYQPTITIEADINPGNVASILIEKYLQHYMDNSIPESDRLEDYIINKIDMVEESDRGLVFSVSFSVQGVSEQSSWRAGNGTIKENGWIEDKFMFVKVIQEGNSFTMTEWNTGGFK